MFPITMDILPIQASAVACKRIFSSGKETDTLKRRKLSLLMTEILQILKYSYKQEALNFSKDWVSTESKCIDPADNQSKHTSMLASKLSIHNILVGQDGNTLLSDSEPVDLQDRLLTSPRGNTSCCLDDV